MTAKQLKTQIDWMCLTTWLKASYNTLWCLIGCSIGDLGTIYFFQVSDFNLPTVYIMALAVVNGIITSIILETIILSRHTAVIPHNMS